jgi:hypothetical protein
MTYGKCVLSIKQVSFYIINFIQTLFAIINVQRIILEVRAEMQIQMAWHSPVKLSSIKVHENLFSISQAVSCTQTHWPMDRTK